MHGIMTILKSDSVPSDKPMAAAVTLADLQSAVGGYIEIVSGFDTYQQREAVAFCNENGKLDGLPVNQQATSLWAAQIEGLDDVLVGDVAVLTGDAEFMEAI